MRATQLGMEEQILAKSEKLRQLRHVVQVSFHIRETRATETTFL